MDYCFLSVTSCLIFVLHTATCSHLHSDGSGLMPCYLVFCFFRLNDNSEMLLLRDHSLSLQTEYISDTFTAEKKQLETEKMLHFTLLYLCCGLQSRHVTLQFRDVVGVGTGISLIHLQKMFIAIGKYEIEFLGKQIHFICQFITADHRHASSLSKASFFVLVYLLYFGRFGTFW